MLSMFNSLSNQDTSKYRVLPSQGSAITHQLRGGMVGGQHNNRAVNFPGGVWHGGDRLSSLPGHLDERSAGEMC